MTGSGATQDGQLRGTDGVSPGQADWWALVDETLKGGPRDQIYSTTDDAINIAPVYGPGHRQYPVLGGGLPAVSRPLVALASPGAAAGAIKTEVEGGARQIALALAAPGQPGLQWAPGVLGKALARVDFNEVEIHLRPGLDSLGGARELLSLIGNNVAPNARFGLGADPIGAAAVAGIPGSGHTLEALASLAPVLLDRPGSATLFLASGVAAHEAGGSPAQELAFAMASAVAYLRALERAGISPNDAGALIAREHAADGDVFLTIAKLRASRLLWTRMMQACGAPDVGGASPLEARISARMMCANDAHVNMIRATAASLGASVGGAAAITVLPFTHPLGQPDDLARRIARNVPVILADESHIGAVRDAAAGSYYVESLTQDLAARAWEIFREIEAAGGIAAMLAGGDFQRQVARVRAARAARIASGEHPLTGVNIYPHPDEARPQAQPWPVPDADPGGIAPLSPIRLDAPFAQLRQSSDEYLAKTGARPAVFFANLGTPRDYGARTAWCAELLGCGGIEHVSRAGFATTEAVVAGFRQAGTGLVCISASDRRYGEMGAAIAQALARAGARYIVQVGDAETARVDGVDGLVYPGCDGLAFLAGLHDHFRSGR